jgi:hypothetical protein
MKKKLLNLVVVALLSGWLAATASARAISTAGAFPPESRIGDVNLDGANDFLDITPFIAALSGNVFIAEADCNEDGVVDFFDISPFIAILSRQ